MKPKTFEELFAGTGIEPTKDENGGVHYNFKATLKTNNMNKEFIPYEQALELKELGFNEFCFGYYVGNELITSINDIFNTTEILIISAPLYQQAFRWFREKYNLLSYIDYCMTETFRYNIVWDGSVISLSGYTTYEEAELACLKKLIEIVKNK